MIDTLEPDLDGEGLSIAIVQARFNEGICVALRDSALAELKRLGVADDDITLITVPGALEIPLACQQLARTGAFDALIALGAVVRGETYHFEVVSNEMAAGITRVSLDEGIVIANGVLTCETDEQAYARVSKGADCAQVAVEMANMAFALNDEGEAQ